MEDQFKALLAAIETLSVANYRTQAKQAALFKMIERVCAQTNSTLQADETTKQTYARLQKSELERMLLTLEDSDSELAAAIQEMIDRIYGE